jgi:acetyl-CoA synthetase
MSDLERFLETRDFLLANRTDYETAYSGFAWPQLDDFNWASDYFDVIARDNSAPALHIVEESGQENVLSYADLSARSSQVANLLVELGLRKGDRVLVMLGNEVALWETMLAVIKLGAVAIPATTLLAGADLADRIERGHARMVVTNDTGAERIDDLEPGLVDGVTLVAVGEGRSGWHPYGDADHQPVTFEAPEPTSPADPLLEYFTSGTTAKPKLVQHTQASYPVGHLSTMYWLGLQPGDVHWTISSPGWAKHAWSCLFAPFNAQACVFMYNYSRFVGPAVLDVLVRYGVNTLCAPPTVWRFLIQEDLSAYPVALRELISAGEPLNPEVIERVRSMWNITIRDGYGQTETTAQVGNPPGAKLVPGSMGRALPGYRIVLLDPDGKESDEGEISIALGDDRPLGLMTGYADDHAKTDQAMEGGHYHTGDVGTRDADGYITYVGRADDVFKASGYRISPFELESALIEHPAVAEAAVVPSPDPLRGFVPKAYVILTPGNEPGPETARSIFEFLRGRVSGYKMIRRIEFADLPKTISGKIRRVELRGLEHARPAEGAINADEYHEEAFR